MLSLFYKGEKLPSYTDVVNWRASQRGKQGRYAVEKRAIEKRLRDAFLPQLAGLELPLRGRYAFRFWWFEPHRRRDPDNIQIGAKFILDTLVRMGVLENDGAKVIGDISHTFRYPKKTKRKTYRFRVRLKEL